MEVTREQKRSLYHLHIELEREYEPIRKRTKINTISNLDMQALRDQGKKHLDIWSDGRLYPIDPITKSSPPFSNSTALLKYMGDGVNGLLGYTYNISSERDILKLENQILKQEKDSLLKSVEQGKERISFLEKNLKALRRK